MHARAGGNLGLWANIDDRGPRAPPEIPVTGFGDIVEHAKLDQLMRCQDGLNPLVLVMGGGSSAMM